MTRLVGMTTMNATVTAEAKALARAAWLADKGACVPKPVYVSTYRTEKDIKMDAWRAKREAYLAS